MTEACATCGADDELLFTCRHCRRRFCERHELPHHACERFQGDHSPSETEAPPVVEAESGETADAVGAAGSAGAAATVEAIETDEVPTEPPVQDTPTEPAPATERPAAPVSGQSPDTATAGEAPVRPMDSRRAVGVVSPSSEPQSLGEWLARQTYLTLLLKVGGLALLINAAFYGGVALTLYDPFGLL